MANHHSVYPGENTGLPPLSLLPPSLPYDRRPLPPTLLLAPLPSLLQCCILKMWLGGQTEFPKCRGGGGGGRRCIRCINFTKVWGVGKSSPRTNKAPPPLNTALFLSCVPSLEREGVMEGVAEGVLLVIPCTSHVEYFCVWFTMNSRCMSITCLRFSSRRDWCLCSTICVCVCVCVYVCVRTCVCVCVCVCARACV